MLNELERAFELTRGLGGDYQLKLTPGEVVTVNHPGVTSHIHQAYRRLFPDFEILDRPFGLEGEDFGHVTQKVPGAIFLWARGLSSRADRFAICTLPILPSTRIVWRWGPPCWQR